MMHIAVIGLSCRLPKAPDAGAFWQLLCNGSSAISETPKERWDVDSLSVSSLSPAEKMSMRWGGFLNEIDRFDAGFFSISSHEAAAMDPQQRLMLELCWEALEDAGIVQEQIKESQTGVFVGAISHDYASLLAQQNGYAITPYTFTGLQRGIIANRVSYVLGTRGPSFSVDAGQSSSLVAVHLAIESLRKGESTLALVGGVNLNILPESSIQVSRLGALSPDGRCFTFDARANGYVRGEGGVAIVLKPLPQAVVDGDSIYGVLLGSAINNDGASDSLTTPRALAQAEMLRNAYRQAGIDPADVQYIELHGTGTRVGDPIEAEALGAILGRGRSTENPLLVGSVKTNVGHLEGAAGITGLLKTILALRARKIPASLNFAIPNPQIPFDTLHLQVPTKLQSWPRPDQPLFAGVSSFGIGGTNCHVVLSAWPQLSRRFAENADEVNRKASEGSLPALLTTSAEHSPARMEVAVPYLLSGKTAQALQAQAERLRVHLLDHPELDLTNVGYVLGTRRTHFPQRGVVLSADRAGLLERLEALAHGHTHRQVLTGVAPEARQAVFVFPGQGHQWAGMARELLEQSAIFRERLTACSAALAPYVSWSVVQVLHEEAGAPSLERVEVVQPVLFAVMVALAGLWRACGVHPVAVVGQSQGEIAAACVAGGLSLEDGARIVALRSRALARLAGQGGMVSVLLSEQAAAQRLGRWGERLSIAVVNSPGAVVVAGDLPALEELLVECEQAGIYARQVPVNYASHSAQVEQLREELEEALREIKPQAGTIPFYSSVTGERLDTRELDGAYWYRNLRQPVQFAQVIQRLLQEKQRVFVEVSGHPILLSGMLESFAVVGAHDSIGLGTLRRHEGSRERFLTTLAELHVHGVKVDWEKVFAGSVAQRVKLPTYAFQRQRYWLDAAPPVAQDGTPAGVRVTRQQLAAMTEIEQENVLVTLVRAEAATILRYSLPDIIGAEQAFKDLGFVSLSSLLLCNRLSIATGLSLSATLIYDYPTPARLAHYLRMVFFPVCHDSISSDPGELAIRKALATIPFSCFREAGVMETLRRLAANHLDTPANKDEAEPTNMIDTMDVADLLQMVKKK